MPAMNRRLQRDLLSDAKMFDALAERDDFTRRLVAQYLRVGGAVGTDAALQLPMHIGPADANRPQPDCDFARSWVRSLWNFPFF